jgi:hypothetical protein
VVITSRSPSSRMALRLILASSAKWRWEIFGSSSCDLTAFAKPNVHLAVSQRQVVPRCTCAVRRCDGQDRRTNMKALKTHEACLSNSTQPTCMRIAARFTAKFVYIKHTTCFAFVGNLQA